MMKRQGRVLIVDDQEQWRKALVEILQRGGFYYELIVKFGDSRKIEEEYRNFTEYVQPFLGGERNTTIIAMRRTPHLAGITYSLLGTTNKQVVDFGEFYHRADISQIKEALDRLFWHTCKAWYASRGQLELVDFQGTGPGHILRDVASLDSAIRFQLLAAEEATLEERLRMEEVLLNNIQRFSQVDQLVNKFSTTNWALMKAYATVVHLRTDVARKLVEANPDADISEYYIALLYNALNTLRFSSLSSLQREHALLCASLLTDRLRLGSQ